jgi:hypothetical protein
MRGLVPPFFVSWKIHGIAIAVAVIAQCNRSCAESRYLTIPDYIAEKPSIIANRCFDG